MNFGPKSSVRGKKKTQNRVTHLKPSYVVLKLRILLWNTFTMSVHGVVQVVHTWEKRGEGVGSKNKTKKFKKISQTDVF